MPAQRRVVSSQDSWPGWAFATRPAPSGCSAIRRWLACWTHSRSSSTTRLLAALSSVPQPDLALLGLVRPLQSLPDRASATTHCGREHHPADPARLRAVVPSRRSGPDRLMAVLGHIARARRPPGPAPGATGRSWLRRAASPSRAHRRAAARRRRRSRCRPQPIGRGGCRGATTRCGWPTAGGCSPSPAATCAAVPRPTSPRWPASSPTWPRRALEAALAIARAEQPRARPRAGWR